MKEVVILIPDVDVEQNIEIEVRINGRKKTIQYRVELLSWEGNNDPPTNPVSVLKKKLAEYDKGWELMEIGAPGKGRIPLMFRKKGSGRRIGDGETL
ncbi:MAG: hypothetical protein HQ565_11350 [Bacteroidetes bacterium]|nr:hypothetical protein [Bacteroidota bacterium]